MGFFKKQRIQRKSISIEQKEKSDKYKRNKFASDELTRLAKESPEIRNKLIEQAFGIKMPTEDPTKKKLQQEIDDEVVKLVSEDPEMKKDLAKRYAEQVLKLSPGSGEDEEYPYYAEGGSEIDRTLHSIRSLRTLQEELGGGKQEGRFGFVADAFSPDGLKAIASVIMALKAGSGNGQSGSPDRVYVVSVNGENVALTESQYEQLLQEGKVEPIKLQSPKPQPEPSVEEEGISPTLTGDTTEEEPELPEFLKLVGLESLSDKMDMPPEDYVDELSNGVDAQVSEAEILWGFFATTDYQGIVKILSPYQSNSKIGPVVKKILSDEGREWIEKVLELIKERNNDQ